MNNKIVIITMMMLISVQISTAYYIGYGEYGMNHTKAQEILSTITKEQSIGLEAIIFTNSLCTGMWGGYCNAASYEWKGNHNRIIIGNMNRLTTEELTMLMKHELKHHEQVMNGETGNRNYFTEEQEQEAYEAMTQ